MVLSFNDDFEVTWREPADAENTWLLDSVHWPLAQPRLSQEILGIFVGIGIEWDVVWVNGYMYVRRLGPPPPRPEVLERGPSDVWFKDYQALVCTMSDEIRDGDYEVMTSEELAAAIPELAAKAGEALLYTTVVVSEMWMGPNALIDFCERELGEDGASLAASMMQGSTNESSVAGEGLGELAADAAGHPEVADALRRGDFEAVLRLAETHPFRRQLDRYLSEYGGRVESWSHLHRPTWRDEPELALKLIAQQMAAPGLSSDAAMQRSVEGRERARAEIESRLAPEKLEELNELLDKVSEYVTLSENRAYWQLTLMGSLRVSVGVLGRRLASSGVIEKPEDIYYLSQEEVRRAAADGTQRYEGLVAERRAEYERWVGLSAPRYVGAAQGPVTVEIEKMRRRFAGTGVADVDALTIKGQPASAGVVRGRARVLQSLEEADRVEAGDILVCRMTSPPWTPLFSVSAGVVTDTGGVLSHSAICARESGIPCVVGTQVATRTIPDGAMITVDGSKGTVVIEG